MEKINYLSKQKAARKIKNTRAIDNAMTALFYAVAGFFLLLLIVFALYVIIKGFVGATPEMFTFTSKGVMNQLFNTVYLVFLALLVSVPIGIAAGIYMAEYAASGPITKVIRICIETLSSLPSIVVGLFGYLVFILIAGVKFNLFAGAMAVSILSLPVITTTTDDALKSLPKHYKQASLGLGATHWQTIFKVLLPACLPRIMTGVILAAGRGFGETAALLYTAGMSTSIKWNNWDLTSRACPLNPFRSGETLSLHIWALNTEATQSNRVELANLSSAILMLLVLAFNITVRIITARMDKKMGGGKK